MKSFTPRPRFSNARVFSALFISFIILVTPLMPVMAASASHARYARRKPSSTNIQPGKALNQPPAAVITATKTDSFPDPNSDGKAEPGDTITYDVNVSNTGATDATGVTFNDTIDPNTTLVAGSLKVSPLAFADTYSATKDIPLSVPAPGVLINDTGTPQPTAVPITSGPTSNGGTVTLNADGSFSYTPPAGFQGADTFTYTATNAQSPDDTATVTINVDAGPTVTTTSPTNGSTNVATNTNITVNFSEPVNASASSFSIQCPSGSPQAFALSASPASSFTLDPVADLPAGTTCTVTVVANQITDADTFDPPDNMASDYVFSFGVKPVAVDDMHSATGNVRINTASSGFSVLANDQGPGISITAFDATSAQGGNVNMNTGTGTFTYDPPRGFTGTDSFNYTISNAAGSDQGTVVLTVSDMIWFINNDPGACSSGCDGRLTHPFNSVAAFDAINGNGAMSGGVVIDPEAGDHIFIYTGTGSYTGPLTLENNQSVIGQGATSSIATLSGITLAPDSDALPTTGGTRPIINASVNNLTLANGNQLYGFDLSNTAATALVGNGFGNLIVSDVSVSNSSGIAIDLNNGNPTASFTRVNSTGGTNGIKLTNTTGNFSVVGDGTNTSQGGNSSGGTIKDQTGADGTTANNGASNGVGIGVYLNNATNVSLRRMTISHASNFAVEAETVTGFNMQYCTVNGGNGTSGLQDEGSVRFLEARGTDTIDNCDISSGFEDNIRLDNNSGTLSDFIISNNKIHDNDATNGNQGILMDFENVVNVTTHITGNTFTNIRADHVHIGAGVGTTVGSVVNAVVKNNTATGERASDLGGGFNISSASFSGTLRYDVSSNTMQGTHQGGAILISSGSGSGIFSGQVANNIVGVSGVPNSGTTVSSAIRVEEHGTGSHTSNVTGNTLRRYGSAGIEIQAGGAGGQNGGMQLTITGNTIAEPSNSGGSTPNGINLNVGTNSGNTNQVCADIISNSIAGSGNNVNVGEEDFRLRQRNATTIQLPGYGGANNNNAAVVAFIQAQNTGTETGSAANTVGIVVGAGGFVGGPSCASPSIPARALPFNDDNGPQLANAPANTQTKQIASETFASHASSKRNAQAMANALPLASAPVPSGETINAPIGTIPSGKSVHITFQVTVNNPLPGGVTQVSNQGTVKGDNFADVLTDDTAAGGSADPTVTPILTPPDISIKDASVAEPSSGSAPATFTVALSHAFSQPVTVSFATANDTGGANPATAGSDYTTTSGTLTFNPGEVLQTISVPVLPDANNTETAETFLVNLSGVTVGTITDAQAVGTITVGGTPGTILISELRTSSPAGPDDDFVELLNNTDSDITVQSSDSSAGWSVAKVGSACSDTPVIVAVIPNGTVIPARGNYLLAGSAYSLGLYAAGDQTLTTNIEDDRNVAVFNTADLANYQTSTRLDAVGFGANTGNNCDLLREGGTLQPASGSASEYSFVRKVDKGETLDTGDNSADFTVVSTTPLTPVGSNTTPTLGAPGPENATGPRGPVPCDAPGTAKFDRSRLDTTQGVGSAPNLVRDTTSDPPNNSTYGTLDFRRRFTNSTGGSVTRLRFRVVNLTTTPASSGAADLRARTSLPTTVTGVNDAATCGGSAPCNVLVQGTTLESPPAQTNGGGVNSTLAAGTITLGTPLANGASVNLRFLFGIQQEGDYRIGIVLEALTNGSIGQDIWQLRGNTQTGGDTDGGCNTPPVANAGADQTVECAGGNTSVTLDGSASSDPDGDTPLTYEWREGATVLGTTATLNTSFTFGAHTITLKVTDPSGDSSEDTVSVNVVDTTDPMITAPPNVNVSTGPGATSCGAFVSNAMLGTATASDGCSSTVTITRTGVPSGNVFPVGQTFVTYTADDGHGHTRSAMQTVTVTDNTPPTISVPANQTVNAPANSCSATVNPGTATANDNCPGVTVTGVRSDSQPLNAPYPVGVTTITWTAKDAANNTTAGTQTITVKDATAPVITLTSGTITLSPPNHQYQTFTIANLVASASDQCDASVDINDVVISQATSDEPEDATGNGDGNTLNDIVITPDCKSVQLRSERAGGGDGRVYTITLKVKDSSGNVGTAVRQVFVPSSGPVINSGVHYTVNGCSP
ncbi:MAG: hypothetical protein QOJ02_2094 [Acidobacteriota bacterium]|nr:hypothetical protein [Acidobacteriota bacterium]